MTEHPMAQPWLSWQPIGTFPQDGETYLADNNEVDGGFVQAVFWDDGRLHVSDAHISYAPGFFTRWAKVPR
jgi:hypothetical protein